MSYTIKSNTQMIDFSVKRSAALAVRNMLQDTHTEAKPNTPREFGDLKDNVIIQVLGTAGTIRWATPYAIYQEKKKFTNYTTPGTGPHFAENAVRKVTDKSQDYFDKALKLTAMPKHSGNSNQGGR